MEKVYFVNVGEGVGLDRSTIDNSKGFKCQIIIEYYKNGVFQLTAGQFDQFDLPLSRSADVVGPFFMKR